MAKKILIVEDDALIAHELTTLVSDLGYTVLGDAANLNDARAMLSGNDVDLVLLDVELEGDDLGTELGRELSEEYQIPFIYVTSFFDDHTIGMARVTNPIAYITKPFRDSDIKANLSLAFHKQHSQATTELAIPDSKYLFVKNKGDIERLNPNEVLYLKGDDNYTHVCCGAKGTFMLSQTLKKVEAKTAGLGFIRVHKSYMVNLAKVQSISGNVLYVDDEPIPIGKTFKKDLMQAMIIL